MMVRDRLSGADERHLTMRKILIDGSFRAADPMRGHDSRKTSHLRAVSNQVF